MAIETFAENDLVVGRGRLYFAEYDSLTSAYGAEMYMGSTPTISLERSAETLEHISTETGLRVKDKSVTLQDDITINFEVENMTPTNVALFFYGDVGLTTQTTVTGATDSIVGALDGHYQLGKTTAYPSGRRVLTSVVVTSGAVTIPSALNYEVDLALGRLHVLPTSVDIQDAEALVVTYNVTAAPRTIVVDSTNNIVGSLRFISDNPEGTDKDVYVPYAKLTPDGQYALKGEEWQKIGFKGEVLKLGTNPRIIFDKR